MGSGMVMPSIPAVLPNNQTTVADYSHKTVREDEALISYRSNELDRPIESDFFDGEGSVDDVDLVFGDDD
jgi:hypothetical protein